jgi:hypothetical protein
LMDQIPERRILWTHILAGNWKLLLNVLQRNYPWIT